MKYVGLNCIWPLMAACVVYLLVFVKLRAFWTNVFGELRRFRGLQLNMLNQFSAVGTRKKFAQLNGWR